MLVSRPLSVASTEWPFVSEQVSSRCSSFSCNSVGPGRPFRQVGWLGIMSSLSHLAASGELLPMPQVLSLLHHQNWVEHLGRAKEHAMPHVK